MLSGGTAGYRGEGRGMKCSGVAGSGVAGSGVAVLVANLVTQFPELVRVATERRWL